MGKKLNKIGKKMSLDFTEDSISAIERMANNYEEGVGPTVNKMIKVICSMPEEIKKELKTFCFQKRQEYKLRYLEAGEFEKKELDRYYDYYSDLMTLINGGEEVNYWEDDPNMMVFKMKDGSLVVPKDWIILNPEQEGKCKYAGVIECRNHDKYNIPHFAFFTNNQYSCDYSDEYVQEIYSMCKEKWPRFSEILKMEVELIPDSTKPFGYKNIEEHLASPIVGLFSILRDDDELFDNKPPYGALIISNN